MVASHNEVSAAMILADQRVPHRFPRPAHTHRQRQQRQLLRTLRILGTEQLITTHPSVIVHIPRLGHAHDRMDQKVGFNLLGGTECQFDVGTVHGIAGLESHYSAPPEARKLRAQFRRSES